MNNANWAKETISKNVEYWKERAIVEEKERIREIEIYKKMGLIQNG